MLYKPEYKYMFCISRKRSLWPSLSLIYYLNSVGIKPYVAVKHQEDWNTIRASNVFIRKVAQIPSDYDILLTEGAGLGMNDEGYERWRIQETAARGKISLSLNMAVSIMNTTVNPYCKDAEKLGVYGICMNDSRSIQHYNSFFPTLHFFNTGNPDWDYLRSEECKKVVNSWRNKLGSRVLVVGCGVPRIEFLSWFKRIARKANQLGFTVILRKHPDTILPEELSKYHINGIHRLALTKIASHYISDNFASTSVAENLFTGTKVGASPLIVHHKSWGNFIWIEEKKDWESLVLSSTDSTRVSEMVPLINSEESLTKFLSDSTPAISSAENQKFFGGPITSNYSEYFFKHVEEKLSIRK